jgi:hypothetical protein
VTPPQGVSDEARRAEEDAAAAATVLALLALSAPDPETTRPDGVGLWGEPAHRLGVTGLPGTAGWWASGMPR